MYAGERRKIWHNTVLTRCSNNRTVPSDNTSIVKRTPVHIHLCSVTSLKMRKLRSISLFSLEAENNTATFSSFFTPFILWQWLLWYGIDDTHDVVVWARNVSTLNNIDIHTSVKLDKTRRRQTAFCWSKPVFCLCHSHTWSFSWLVTDRTGRLNSEWMKTLVLV